MAIQVVQYFRKLNANEYRMSLFQVSYKGEQLGLLGEGRYFGLPGVVYGRNKPVKVSTATHCHFFCLEYDDFSRVSKKYHKFLLELKVLRVSFAHFFMHRVI